VVWAGTKIASNKTARAKRNAGRTILISTLLKPESIRGNSTLYARTAFGDVYYTS
jgi:hypothetical protein